MGVVTITRPPKSLFPLHEQVGAIAIMVIFAAIGGLLIGALGGFNIPKIGKFKGYHVKPILKHVSIPPLIGMIFMGFIARNYVGGPMDAYNNRWASFIKYICLCMLMVRGGLNVTFRGKGLTVVLLSVVP